MRERLQKIIASAGICSRRAAEKLIQEGRVSVNGVPAGVGESADPEQDAIAVDGDPLQSAHEKVYIALNKPRGYLSAISDPRGRRTVSLLVRDCGCSVYPVGRLDLSSEGLLLMTNDGEFAYRMTHPRFEKEKSYLVSVEGDAAAAYSRLCEPVVIEGRATSPAKVEIVSSDPEKSKVRFWIHEGRNRQIRRICEAAGLKVKRLIRVSEGSIELGDLRPGEWRYLTRDEVRELAD